MKPHYKITFYLLITGLFIILSCTTDKSINGPGKNKSDKWVLTWSDEFDDESVDLTKWSYMIGDGSDYGYQPGWGNNEQQYYTAAPSNSGIIIDDDGNSCLLIEAINEQVSGYHYTSAKLTTENLYDFRFGKVEARIKLPYSKGIWPAFWTLGANDSEIVWPGCGEIDILEMVGNSEETIHGNVHYVNSEREHDDYHGSNTLVSGKYSDDYHLYSIEWSPESIQWLVDGEYCHEVTIEADMKEFLRSHYLILNVAVGGYWPGYPDESSVFPQRMLVDYIRVYQDTTLADIPEEPVLDIEEESLNLGLSSAEAAINSEFTPFHDVSTISWGPGSPEVSFSTVAAEGETSVMAVYPGGGWGGLYFELKKAIDMSEYADGYLSVMLDVPDNFKDFEVKVESKDGDGSVNLFDYTPEPVDHIYDHYKIPLNDFVTKGVNLELLHIPLGLWNPKDENENYTSGNVLVDNIYFLKSE